MIARGDLDYVIVAPTDKDQMIGPLKAANDAGIKVITVDTFLGDGNYATGPVTFPLSYIGSDNVEGGRISARGLAKAIGGKGSVYINSTNPNVSSVEGRATGFKEVMAKEYPNVKIVGLDFNLDDMNKAEQQTAAVLQRVPISLVCSERTCSALRVPGQRSSMLGWAAMCKWSPTMPPRPPSN